MHISEKKQELRRAITERLDRMTPEQRHAESRTLCRVLLMHLPPDKPVCTYFPLKSEPDMRMLIKGLLAKRTDVYLPRFEDGKMVYRKLDDLEKLAPGEFTIPEPPASAKLLDPKDAHVILIPGRAFDKKGNRLGRGSGGFDSWIAEQRKRNPTTEFWGVCLQCQLVNEIPLEEHDEKMDVVATANEWIDLRS